MKGLLNWGCRLQKEFFSCGENSLHSHTSGLDNPLGLEVVSNEHKDCFLNGNIEEKIYMDKPIGFVSKDQEDKKFVILQD